MNDHEVDNAKLGKLAPSSVSFVDVVEELSRWGFGFSHRRGEGRGELAVGKLLSQQTEAQRSRLEEHWADHLQTQERKIRALELLQLGDDEWETLGTIRKEFGEALEDEQEDGEAQLRLVEFAVEVIHGHRRDDGESWADEVGLDAESVEAVASVERERAAFFDRYFAAKDSSGLKTQRDVADAAGLSPATVQAIEARRVKPQFKTVQKLAAAFGVEVSQLLGE